MPEMQEDDKVEGEKVAHPWADDPQFVNFMNTRMETGEYIDPPDPTQGMITISSYAGSTRFEESTDGGESDDSMTTAPERRTPHRNRPRRRDRNCRRAAARQAQVPHFGNRLQMEAALRRGCTDSPEDVRLNTARTRAEMALLEAGGIRSWEEAWALFNTKFFEALENTNPHSCL